VFKRQTDTCISTAFIRLMKNGTKVCVCFVVFPTATFVQSGLFAYSPVLISWNMICQEKITPINVTSTIWNKG